MCYVAATKGHLISLSKSKDFDGIVPSIFDYMNHLYLSSWGRSRHVITNKNMQISISFICISMIVVLKGIFKEFDYGISKYSNFES